MKTRRHSVQHRTHVNQQCSNSVNQLVHLLKQSVQHWLAANDFFSTITLKVINIGTRLSEPDQQRRKIN